jgi:hypothetical protein
VGHTTHLSLSDNPQIYIKTLGVTAIQLNGQLLPLPPRGCVLVAILALSEGKKLSKTQIGRLIWGGVSESSARHSLSQLVHTLRRYSLALVEVRNNAIHLNAEITSDFERVLAKLDTRDLAGALKLLDGDFLADMSAYTSAFEDWRSEKQRFLADRLLSRVHSELGINWLKGHVDECRALENEVASRLKTYWNDSEFAEHWGQVLRQTKPETNARQCRPHFVGRDFELATLFQKYELLREGVGGTVAILGGTGIGKTTLANTFLRGVSQAGGFTITIRSYEADQTRGHRILHQLMESNPFRTKCSFIQLDNGAQQKDAILANGAHEQRERTHFLYDEVAKALVRISSEAQLILFIDDLHWTDESSIDFVKFLARLTDNSCFLLVVALRNEHPRYAPFAELVRSQSTTVLDLQNLQKSDLVALARERSTRRQSASVAKALWSRTGGHPYLVGEMIRCLSRTERWTERDVHSTFPSTVAAYLRVHTQGLDPSSRLLMMALATLGRPVPHTLLRRICGLTLPQFALSINPLFEHDLAADENGVLRCNHDFVRELVYGGMNVSQRRSMHRRIAGVLERGNAQPSEILYHYRLARCRRKTYIGALKEAKRNLVIGAGPEADYNYRLAMRACLSGRKRGVIRWRRTQAAAATGLLTTAKKQLEHIKSDHAEILCRNKARIELLDLEIDRELSISSPEYVRQRAQIVRMLAAGNADYDTEANALVVAARGHLLDAADEDSVTAIIEEIDKLADRVPDHLVAAIGRAWAAGALVLMGKISDAARLLDVLACRPHLHENPRFLSTYHSSKALYHAFSGELADSIDLFRSAATLAEEARMWRHRKNILGNLSGVLIETADYTSAGLTLAQLVQTAQVDEALPHLSLAHINYGLLSLAKSDLPAARNHASRGLTLGEKLRRPWAIAYATALLGLVALEGGRLAEARQRRAKLLELDGTYLGNDVVPIEKLLVRVAELEGELEWATARLLHAMNNPRLSAVCQTALKIEFARLSIRLDPRRAAQAACEAREKCRLMGAVQLYDAADALVERARPA